MKSKIAIVTALLGLSLTLSACDKCGGLQELRAPVIPHACRDAGAR